MKELEEKLEEMRDERRGIDYAGDDSFYEK